MQERNAQVRNPDAQNLLQQQKKEKRLEDLQQLKRHLSITSIFTIPFIAMNFYDKIYMLIHSPISAALLLYKDLKYPLPSYALIIQGIVIAAIIFTQLMRYFMAKKSVVQKDPSIAIQYLILSLILIPIYVFMLRLQTYVLFIDWVMNWIGLVFLILETFMAAWLFKVFQSKKKNS